MAKNTVLSANKAWNKMQEFAKTRYILAEGVLKDTKAFLKPHYERFGRQSEQFEAATRLGMNKNKFWANNVATQSTLSGKLGAASGYEMGLFTNNKGQMFNRARNKMLIGAGIGAGIGMGSASMSDNGNYVGRGIVGAGLGAIGGGANFLAGRRGSLTSRLLGTDGQSGALREAWNLASKTR